MSIQHANRGIVKKDLQLYYNREFNGSFLGEAAMNFFSIPAYFLQKEGNHSTSFSTSTTSGIPDLVVPGNKQVYYAPEYITLVATGAWVAESNRLIIYPRRDASGGANSYNPSGTYRISFYARVISGNTALGFAFYGNSINNTATLTSKWQRFSANSSHGGAMIIEFGNLNAGTMVCQIACIQVEAKSYATPFTLPALWSPNLVNVTSTSGHTIMTKNTSGDSWVNARVYSSEGYTEPCHVSFKASQTNLALMISLNTNPVLKGVQYSTLDYAWHPTTNGLAYIYESGTDRGSQGSYTTSTIFQIIYDGVNINYYMDGVLKRSVARSGSGPLYLDSSFYSNSSIVNSLSFGPLLQINRFSNYTIGGGGLLDISGNNVNADLTNVSFDSTGYIFGGSANYIDLPSSTFLDFNLNNFSIFTWIKSSATGNFGNIFNNMNVAGTLGVQFLTKPSNGGCRVWVGDLSHDNTVNVTNGSWNYIGFVRDGDYVYFYVNGSLSTTGTGFAAKNATPNSGNDRRIGRQTTNTAYDFNGQISNFKIYSRLLTAAEVLQNFNATRKTYGL
jgi:hypothetical protein